MTRMGSQTYVRKGGTGGDRTQFGHKQMNDGAFTGAGKQPGEYTTVQRHHWLGDVYDVAVNTATGLTDDEFDLAQTAQVEALLWSGIDEQGDALDARYDSFDIDQATIDRLTTELHRFIAENRPLVDRALASNSYGADSGDGSGAHGQLGHDFWLSRNGYGAGFQDRVGLSGDLGRQLAAAAKNFGELTAYVGDDEKVHAG